MAGPNAVNAPLFNGFRRKNNFKNSNIKKSLIGIEKRLSGKVTSFGQLKYQNRGMQNSSRESNESREVRVIVSNLALSVISDDLCELFDQFNPRNVSLDIENQGSSDGSLTVSKHNADRLIEKFDGKFALDGEVLKITVANTSSISNRVKFPDIQKRIHFTGRQAQSYPKNSFVYSSRQRKSDVFSTKNRFKHSTRTHNNLGNKNHRKQSKKTVEELDAELDAYMSHSN